MGGSYASEYSASVREVGQMKGWGWGLQWLEQSRGEEGLGANFCRVRETSR